MTRSSEIDEARRALERELAAELAELSADDVGFNETASDEDFQDGFATSKEMDYIHSDIDSGLNKKIKSLDNGLQDRDNDTNYHWASTTWVLLLQRVDKNDREFFQQCHEDLQHIRASILDMEDSSSLKEEMTEPTIDKNPQPLSEINHQANIHETVLSSLCDTNEERELGENLDKYKQDRDKGISNHSLAKISSMQLLVNQISPLSLLNQTMPSSDTTLQLSLSLENLQDRKTVASSDKQPEKHDQVTQEKLDWIEKQQQAREQRRLKIQNLYEKECAAAAQLLLQLQEEYKAQEKIQECSRRETQERTLMSTEDTHSREYATKEREEYESQLMIGAEKASRKYEEALFQAESTRKKEVAQMTLEDQAEKHRKRIEWFRKVLVDLIERCWTQQKREINRSLMIIEDELTCAFEKEIQEREREKKCGEEMEEEEKRIRFVWNCLKEKVRRKEEQSRFDMKHEEKRCQCAWIFLTEQEAERERKVELQRLETLNKYLTGFEKLGRYYWQQEVRECLIKWKSWLEQYKEMEYVRSEAATKAAKQIQTWYRSRLNHRMNGNESQLFMADLSNEEAPIETNLVDAQHFVPSLAYETAARRLQSTFRGHYIRQKFVNALALAEAVEDKEDEVFDALNLEELIQLPPELVEGWENPVLPLTSQSPTLQMHWEAERDEVNEQDRRNEANIVITTSESNALTSIRTATSPKETCNLAATLWHRMKRVKQRQQHVQQERQHDRDPLYRVQKLLSRKAPIRQKSNPKENFEKTIDKKTRKGNFISWSSTTTKKKKRENIKVPSLVERLRMQTMAER